MTPEQYMATIRETYIVGWLEGNALPALPPREADLEARRAWKEHEALILGRVERRRPRRAHAQLDR